MKNLSLIIVILFVSSVANVVLAQSVSESNKSKSLISIQVTGVQHLKSISCKKEFFSSVLSTDLDMENRAFIASFRPPMPFLVLTAPKIFPVEYIYENDCNSDAVNDSKQNQVGSTESEHSNYVGYLGSSSYIYKAPKNTIRNGVIEAVGKTLMQIATNQ